MFESEFVFENACAARRTEARWVREVVARVLTLCSDAGRGRERTGAAGREMREEQEQREGVGERPLSVSFARSLRPAPAFKFALTLSLARVRTEGPTPMFPMSPRALWFTWRVEGEEGARGRGLSKVEEKAESKSTTTTQIHLRFAAPAFSGCCAGCLLRVVTADTLAMFSSSARPCAGPEPARSIAPLLAPPLSLPVALGFRVRARGEKPLASDPAEARVEEERTRATVGVYPMVDWCW